MENEEDLGLADRIMANPRNRLIIFGTLFGWGSDLFSILLFNAWRYNNAFPVLVSWPIIWLIGYYIGDAVRFLIWLPCGSKRYIERLLPKLGGYCAVGLAGIGAEIISVSSGNLIYSTASSQVILFNGNPLPVVALIGWPITSLIVCGVTIELYNRFRQRWGVNKTLAVISLCIIVCIAALNLLYVYTANLIT